MDLCYPCLFVLSVQNLQCPTSVLFCQYWKKWWWLMNINRSWSARKLSLCFKINIKMMILLFEFNKLYVKWYWIEASEWKQCWHNVYLQTLFSWITSAKPHPDTGSFTTSFLMSGNTAQDKLNTSAQIKTKSNKMKHYIRSWILCFYLWYTNNDVIVIHITQVDNINVCIDKSATNWCAIRKIC